jgi:predicted NUDIX family phosphoesterase
MPPEEQVLVVHRSVFESVGAFQGVCFDVDRYLPEFFTRGVPRFIPRPAAEADPSYKQLIPYVVMTHAGKCLSYVRGKRAGETRLVGRRSIGIGGHINPIDDSDSLFEPDLFDTYRAAVQREVDEEVAIPGSPEDRIVALINDDSTEVGQVHLGVVHLWRLESDVVEKREQMMTQLGFASPEALRSDRENLETWSQLCLDHFDRLLTQPAFSVTSRD